MVILKKIFTFFDNLKSCSHTHTKTVLYLCISATLDVQQQTFSSL
uniref:Uncharacterized protein n=1 Tax=Anguilla anguilla TaxID=7936 RepID=A0A0E9ST16_ANGAN